MIIGKGLCTMNRNAVFDFDYPQHILPVIRLNQDSTAHGEIKLDIDVLEEIISLTSEVYLVNPPSSSNNSWQTTGVDVSSATVISLSSKRLTSGHVAVVYAFDPSSINGIGDGQYYGVLIKVNSADDATTAQAGIEMIIKVNDNIVIS